jgi:hypothetical protein
MMAAIGPLVFAILAWGSLAVVAGVFGYELYAIVRERRAR